MKKPRLAYQLEKACSRAFLRTRGGVAARFDNQLEQIQLMDGTYGAAKVLEDFELWAATADKGYRFPLDEYLKVVDERLGKVATEEDDPRVAQITAVVYEITNDIPTKSAVKKLLEKYPVEDIEYAFRDYTCTLDEIQMKTAIKKFFTDDGAAAIIANIQNG